MNRCPHCKQPIPAPRQAARICHKCDQPITRHMKWRFVTVRGRTVVEHRHCDHPFDYVPRRSK